MVSDSNVIRKWHLTLRKESRDPFSMYSTTIITGLPAKHQRDTSALCTYFAILAALQRLFTVAEYIKYFQNSHLYHKHNSLCYS